MRQNSSIYFLSLKWTHHSFFFVIEIINIDSKYNWNLYSQKSYCISNIYKKYIIINKNDFYIRKIKLEINKLQR